MWSTQKTLQAMQGTTSSGRPSSTLRTHSGSAMWPRAPPTMSILPAARISSASRGSENFPMHPRTGVRASAALIPAIQSTS